LWDASRQVNRVDGATQNIRRAVNLQNELEQSEKQYKEAFDKSGSGML